MADSPEPTAEAGATTIPLLKRGSPMLRWVLGALVTLVIIGSVSAAGLAAWGDLPDFEWKINGWWLTLAVLGFVALNLTHAALWRLLVEALGAPLALTRGLAIWCTSGLARYTPGTILYSALRLSMAQTEGVPLRTSLATVIYELALMMTSTVLVGSYGLLQGDALGSDAVRVLVLAIPVVSLVCLHPRIFAPLVNAALRKAGRPPLSRTLPLGVLLRFLALYCLSWIGAGLCLYALIQGIHPVAPHDLVIVVVSPAVGFVAAGIGFLIPGGLGARETGVAAVLNLAVPLGVAVAVAIVLRLVQLAVEIVCASVLSVVAGRR